MEASNDCQFVLYQYTAIGELLKKTLNEYKDSDTISDPIPSQFINTFNKVFTKKISECHNKLKGSIKATITNFRHCDDTWYFTAKNVSIKTEQRTFPITSMTVIAMDEKLKNKH